MFKSLVFRIMSDLMCKSLLFRIKSGLVRISHLFMIMSDLVFLSLLPDPRSGLDRGSSARNRPCPRYAAVAQTPTHIHNNNVCFTFKVDIAEVYI